MTRSPRHLVAIAAPALAAALVLTVSGCGTRESGSAAVVGDRRISVAAVQDAYQDIAPLVGADAEVTQGQILNLLILEPYLTRAAAAQGRGVSTEDTRQNMKTAGATDTSKISNAGLEVWRANLAFSVLQPDPATAASQAVFVKIGQDLKKAGVQMNPRYGAGFDYTTFSTIPETPNWLTTSKVTATPTPAAPAPEPTPTP